MDKYDAQQVVGIDLHRRRTVIVRMTRAGEHLDTVRIDNDPLTLAAEIVKAGKSPEVVLEATYGWYWATTKHHQDHTVVGSPKTREPQ